jgi:ribosomal protein S19E (S16A)
MIKEHFSKNGISDTTLKYAQMRRGKPATPNMVVALAPKRFKSPYEARRCFQTLERLGLVSRVGDDSWAITPKGSEYLRLTAKPYVGEYAKVRK